MGLLIWLEAGPEAPPCPEPMNLWDDKFLIDFLELLDEEQWFAPDGTATTLERATGGDLAPLRKIAGQDFGLEDYADLVGVDEAESVWREATTRNEAAWQNPRELSRCLRALAAAWDVRPGVWAALRDHRNSAYYAEGIARRDLTGLLRHAQWAADHGARRVRLVVG